MKQIIIFLSLFLSQIFATQNLKDGFGEDYYNLDTEEKRKIFFVKMNAMFDESFKEIAKEQDFINAFFKQANKDGFRTADQENLEKLLELKEKYRVQNLFDYYEYKKRIAPIPKSMGIAQALVESATGTSRFAREANNLFGEWTWGDKGLIPDSRHPKKKHKIKIFDSLQDSVNSYVLNLNRHFAYADFREARYKDMKEGKKIQGLEAIKTLHAYSELKGHYIELVIKVINKYNLEKYDNLNSKPSLELFKTKN
ncbi:glucosaminidase domain-containing protein [Campylobacter estrildidarum]|uniref:Mannosyl-glycoprotein endo-beta-N-acetylglucosamidase n=1 Tax=Campylobacter estrildidarum TaxID=2510189 RepID=A0A4U7BRX7_9BACT|nr:glucosaminidase domain-containing protein [Campylobacter estrildidarum]TKX31484.1 mannosyl-glycoprotein endo-beta-N-acetylglucosamidase [Campylobacter estrildidarum]